MRKNVTEARRCEALPSRFSFSWRLHSRGHHGADDRSLRPPYAGGQSRDDGGPGPGHDGGLPAKPVPLAVAGADPFLGMGVWAWGQGLRASGPGRRRFAGPQGRQNQRRGGAKRPRPYVVRAVRPPPPGRSPGAHLPSPSALSGACDVPLGEPPTAAYTATAERQGSTRRPRSPPR